MPGQVWSNITGALVYQGIARDDRAEVPLPGHGNVYRYRRKSSGESK